MNETARIEGARTAGGGRALIAAPFVAGAATGAAVPPGLGGVSSTTARAPPRTASTTLRERRADGVAVRRPDDLQAGQPGRRRHHRHDRRRRPRAEVTLALRPGRRLEQAQAEEPASSTTRGQHHHRGPRRQRCLEITVRFTDGTTAKATLVGSDPSTDTAVIKVSVAAGKLTPLALADSSAVEPGEGVVAIGSPFGYAESITAGIVSAVDRDIEAPNGYTIPNAIQTDAPINHGNSGGPLIDASGNVVGVNVQIATDSQNGSSINAGVGFAVPSNTVKSVVTALIAGKTVEHAYLGVTVGDNASGSGAQVGTVRAGSPAAAAGLKSGDVITAVDGVTVENANQLTAAVSGHRPGDELRLTVTRNGSTVQLKATLATRPATTTA